MLDSRLRGNDKKEMGMTKFESSKGFLHFNVILFSQKVFQGILISFVCWPSFVL